MHSADHIIQHLGSEVFFRTSRSGGKGGQHVNKVETAAEVWWSVAGSQLLDQEQREMILDKLKNRINKDGMLIVRSSETRSQLENKELALFKLQKLVAESLFVPRKRKPTRISKAVKEKRLEHKKRVSLKKQLRKKDF